MTLSDRNKRFELSDATPDAERPKIWIDGRQRPRFNLRAFGATSLGMARRGLLPEMVEAEARLAAFGQRVMAGEVSVRLDWAGRAGRVLPSHQRVGGWMSGLAGMFAGARALLVGPVEVQGDLAYPDLIGGPGSPVRLRAVVKAPANPLPRAMEEPTLHAIRSAIGTAAQGGRPDQRGAGHAALPVKDADAAGGMSQHLTRPLWRAGCWAMLGILLAFALPGGAIKAMLFHLDGGDLADWT